MSTLLSNITRESCVDALLGMLSNTATAADAQQAAQLLSHLARLAQAALQNSNSQATAPVILHACGLLASQAVTCCGELVASAEAVSLVQWLLQAAWQRVGGVKAAEATVELLFSISAEPVSTRRPELGGHLYEGSIAKLVPVAMYPLGFTDWDASDIDEQLFQQFRSNDLTDLAAQVLETSGIRCDLSNAAIMPHKCLCMSQLPFSMCCLATRSHARALKVATTEYNSAEFAQLLHPGSWTQFWTWQTSPRPLGRSLKLLLSCCTASLQHCESSMEQASKLHSRLCEPGLCSMDDMLHTARSMLLFCSQSVQDILHLLTAYRLCRPVAPSASRSRCRKLHVHAQRAWKRSWLPSCKRSSLSWPATPSSWTQ
jgi:hypothetical protein